MNNITVVDARMGRGKSSAAIRYMNEHKKDKHFLYITPYLAEVARICEQCDFDQPDSDYASKSKELKFHLQKKHNIAATHSLFYLMDDEAVNMVKNSGYTLIIDESIETISKLQVSNKDFELITKQLTTEDSDGILHWIDKEYTGKFDGYKEVADVGSLYKLGSSLLSIMSPGIIRAFDEVFMLTYMFDGQYQKAYLDFFNFKYRIVGIESDENGYKFSNNLDSPPPMNYKELIEILDNKKMNAPGDKEFALSKNWYGKRKYDSPDIKVLRNGMKNFFRDTESNERLWTCFKEDCTKLISSNGRFRSSFLQISAKATNEYKNRTYVAYMVNRFIDPNIKKFFMSKDIEIDEDQFALSEMLQWIWRSAIRDGNGIKLYIPSSRMRNLLIDWINKN